MSFDRASSLSTWGCGRARPHSRGRHLQPARSSRRCRQGNVAARSGRQIIGAQAWRGSNRHARDRSPGARRSSSDTVDQAGRVSARLDCRSPAPALRQKIRRCRTRPQGSATPSRASYGMMCTGAPVACQGTRAGWGERPSDHAPRTVAGAAARDSSSCSGGDVPRTNEGRFCAFAQLSPVSEIRGLRLSA